MFKYLVKVVVLTLLVTSTVLAKKPKNAMPPAFVETATVKTVFYPDQISSVGTLVSIPGIMVKPEISGRITKLYFDSGIVVQKGQPLVQINPDIIKADLEAAKAELKLNKLNFKRSEELYKTRNISKSDFDQAQANYNFAKAKVASAEALLRQTTIVAPFTGKLGLNKVNVGDYISPDQEIVSLQTIDPLKVDFSIPEIYQNKVAVNQAVFLRSDAHGKKFFRGSVEAIESIINQSNRALNIRANVPNGEAKLMPGGFVEVVLRFSNRKVAVIPQTAIVYDVSGNYVFKIVGGKAVKTKVALGAKDNKMVVVNKGLKAGDVIVATGQMKVHPQGSVVVVGKKIKKQDVKK